MRSACLTGARAVGPDITPRVETLEKESVELTRFGGHLQTVCRRCSDAENTFRLRAGVPAADGRAGSLGSLLMARRVAAAGERGRR